MQANIESTVIVREVGEDEMRVLNKRYRNKDKPTNVLTFSYPLEKMWVKNIEHDEYELLVCFAVGQAEASSRQVEWRDYLALLLIHAFLHACGLDHENSCEEAKTMNRLEKEILVETGFQLMEW
jgi:probable rRNA maturation factor